MNGLGYYKNDDGNLLYAATKVSGADFELIAAAGTPASPAIHGWQWFADEAAARTQFGLPAPLMEQPIPFL